MLWAIFSILILLILGIVLIFVYKKGEINSPDHYTLFIIGVVWFPLGIVFNNPVLWILGLVFLTAGLLNKKKWKKNRKKWEDLDKKEKRIKIVLIIFLGILILLGLFFYFLHLT